MNDKVWEYRVVRGKQYNLPDDNSVTSYSDCYSIQEVYFDGDEPYAQTIDLQVGGKTLPEMRTQLQKMIWALDKEIIDEITPNEITIEQRVLELEEENSELRDKLSELDGELVGTDGRGNDIYESSSGDGVRVHREKDKM